MVVFALVVALEIVLAGTVELTYIYVGAPQEVVLVPLSTAIIHTVVLAAQLM